MGEIKNRERFAEMERIIGDYFDCHLAPLMDDTRSYLNRRQAEEMAEYSTSAAGIISSLVAAGNPMTDPYQTLKVTGEWNSKTTEDYLEMCREKIADNKEIQSDLALMAGEWRTAVVGEIGRERYDELSGQLGGDLAYAYMEYRIGQRMTDRLVRESMPKSSAEYIMRKALQNTLFGLAATMNRSPLAAEIERQGEAAYKPSGLEKGAGQVIGAGIDTLALGGVGSWVKFAGFVGADLALSALTSSGEKEKEMTVEECISKGVFGSDGNVFDRFRKDAGEIREDRNAYILATNERLARKIPVRTFDFGDWMKENTMIYNLSGDIAGKDESKERYKDVPLVVAPEYREAYLQDMEYGMNRKSGRHASEKSTEQKDNGVGGQPEAQHTGKKEIPEQTANTYTMQSSGKTDETEIPVEEKAKEKATVNPHRERQPEHRTDNTNGNGWEDFFSTLGLDGMGDIGRNLGYVMAMLPDILVGMFTGRTKSLDIGDNVLPIASVVAGIFIKNPLLKMLMIGLGGANLMNKAGHEALGWKRNENGVNGEKHTARYKVYADEPLDPRISNPVLQGSNLVAVIDRVPCTIQLPGKVVDAYRAGALPLNTLANAVLAQSDRTREMMERNFESGERETVTRTRGIQ